MAGLFCTDEEFRADVEALQAKYEKRCKSKELKPNAGSSFPTAAAAGARGDWAFNPSAVSR